MDSPGAAAGTDPLEGDRIFLRLLETDCPFFSLKLRYEGDHLVQAVLDGRQILPEAEA